MLTRLFRSINTRARRFAADRRGNVAIISALALPALMGTFGLGTEVASWYANQRAMQNAADSAALAAASNASANYDVEAKAVTAQYGFKDGQNGVAVAVSNAAPCPAGVTPPGGAGCYSVTISRSTPLILAQFVGYKGDTTVSGAPAKRIAALAVATQSTVPRPYCLVTLGQGGVTLNGNGTPFADLSGCNVMSNGDAVCNGNNHLNADIGDAHGTNTGCGLTQHSNVPLLADPYSDLAKNIQPDTSCGGSYTKGETISGSWSLGPNKPVCGTLTLAGDTVITNIDGPTTLTIYNGDLNLAGHKLSTADGSQLTIVFSGDNGYSHTMIGGGGLDIQAPLPPNPDAPSSTASPWQGVAVYDDPKITSGTNITAAGNSPTWDISGIVYMPHALLTLSGAVNKSSHGDSCFILVADTVRINGTGSILAHSGCAKQGVIPPSNPVPGRGKLVL